MPDINEYNAEYIRLLQANIMNIVYKDKYSVNDYYILNREGKLDLSTKKNEIVVVKEDEVETVNDRKFVIFKIFIILIVFIILWITFVM